VTTTPPQAARAPEPPRAVQLQLALPYTQEARSHPRVRAWLDRGYRVVDLQRITDHEVLVTLGAGEER